MTTTLGQIFNRVFCLAISLILATSAFAQSTPAPSGTPQQLPSDVVYDISDFSKMLYSHSNPFNNPLGAADDVFNIRANDQYGSMAKRPALNAYGSCRSSAVTGLYRYYKSDATKYTVTTALTDLDYISDTNTCTNLYATLTTGKRMNFITYKNLLIGTNGFDLPIKWDGSILNTADTIGARTAGDLVTQLGAPFAQIATGTGLTASRWYQYKVAFYNGTNYQYETARSNPLLLGTVNKQILLNSIPLGPPGTTDRYIYRTLGQTSRANVIADTTYFQTIHIADNSTVSITDSAADATISGDNAPTYATVSAGSLVSPPHGVYPFINQDYIWLADDVSGTPFGQSTAYFSNTLNPDYWPLTNFFLIRPDDGDSITGINSFLGTLLIFKTNSISKIYTDNSIITSWTLSQPFSSIGCVAPYSIVQTPVGIFYLGRYGLYKFDGQQSTIISDVVTKDIRDINPTNYANVVSIYYNNEYRLAYTSQTTGSGVNDRVLLFDTVRDSYVKDTENVNAWVTFNSSDDFGGLYSGSSLTDGEILAHTTQETSLVQRYLSDLNNGTFSHTIATGTNDAPILSLGSTIWSADPSAWNSESTSTWLIDASPGTWISPIIQISANALSKVYWNPVTTGTQTTSIALRTGSSVAAVNSASWSSEFTNPAGSDISGVTPNIYIQIRVTLSTSDFISTPYLQVLDNFMIKLVYSQTGNSYETTVPSSWISGWLDLIPSPYMGYLANYPKTIKEIDVYYEGTSGTVNVNFQNLKGDSSATFNIDLSQPSNSGNPYWGYGTSKVFTWLPSNAGGLNPPPYGDRFKLFITENGLVNWKIQKIKIRYDANNYVPYH